MLDIFNTPTPQGANYQEFYGGGTDRDWIKPRGASMVRMLLIGAGGGGGGAGVGTANGGNPGASAAVTEWIGPAIFIPDVLRVSIGAGGLGGVGGNGTTINGGTVGGATTVIYQAKDGTGYTLLTANGGGAGGTGTTVGTAGAASSNNFFGAAGIFSSIAGQTPTRNADITNNGVTFLTSGASGAVASTSTQASFVTPAYGYTAAAKGTNSTTGDAGPGGDGYFLTQPILVGCGGSGGGTTSFTGANGGAGGRGGIGCGGGGGGRGGTSGRGGAGGRGGDGAVFIWAW